MCYFIAKFCLDLRSDLGFDHVRWNQANCPLPQVSLAEITSVSFSYPLAFMIN